MSDTPKLVPYYASSLRPWTVATPAEAQGLTEIVLTGPACENFSRPRRLRPETLQRIAAGREKFFRDFPLSPTNVIAAIVNHDPSNVAVREPPELRNWGPPEKVEQLRHWRSRMKDLGYR